MARVRGFEMGYDDDGHGLPVLLLHGFPFNRSMWSEQAAALSHHYRIIAPDLRGFGQSSGDTDSLTMEELARDVAALLDALRIERAVVGGLSMGGYVTLAFYRLFPERVSALLLADTRPQSDDEEGKRTREETARRALSEGMEPIFSTMLPKLLTSGAIENETALVARVRSMVLNTSSMTAAAALRGMARRLDQRDLLPRIDVPTLIIVGAEDRLTPPSEAEQMSASIPDSSLRILDGAAHMANLERPVEFNSAILEFLEGHRLEA
jgi:pimeloyl-ACP methyl ester carboxylesterase